MAKPTLYTDELFETICDRIAGGTPLEWICEEAGMPKPRTVRDWVGNNTELARKYKLAREDGADAIAAHILRIADTPLEAFMEEQERREVPKPADAGDDYKPQFEFITTKRTRKDALEHRKFQCEIRLKLLAKWDPRYAERLALEHNIGAGFAEQLKAARERTANR